MIGAESKKLTTRVTSRSCFCLETMLTSFLVLFALPQLASAYATLPQQPLVVVGGAAVARQDLAKPVRPGSLQGRTRLRATSVAAQATPAARVTKNDLIVSSLAFAAGVADVLTTRQFGCFLNMMTGMTMKMSLSLVAKAWADVAYFTVLFASYFSAFALYRVVERRSKAAPQPIALGRLFAPLVALCMVAADVMSWAQPGTKWAAVSLALGFGLVNAVATESTGAITCMITGHLQRLTSQAVDRCAGPIGAAQASKAATSIFVVAMFAAGVAAGAAFLPTTLGTVCFSPLALVYFAALINL